MREKNKNITIVIVTYKSKHIIESCLKNIYDHYPIIIVDNNSRDEIGLYLKENYPNVDFIGLDDNIGFGRANNIGLNKVNTDFALVLNPDAIIAPTDIEFVISKIGQYDNVALACPLVKEEKLDKIRKKQHKIRNFFEDNDVITTDFVYGCCMFFNMKIMKQIGFFDENIFLYGEDDIISLKTMENGFNNLIIKNIKIIHNNKTSSKVSNSNKLDYLRAYHLGFSKAYINKLYPNHNKITKISIFIFKAFVSILLGNKKKYLKYKYGLEGYVNCLKGKSPFLRKLDSF